MTLIPKGVKPGRMSPVVKFNRAHYIFICSLPCVCCGSSGTTWHHLLRIPLVYREMFPDRKGHSMGKRADDAWTIPMCKRCHDSLHDDGSEPEFLARYAVDGPALAAALFSLTGDTERALALIGRDK